MSYQCTMETFQYWRCVDPISSYDNSLCWQYQGTQLVNANLLSLPLNSQIVVRGRLYDQYCIDNCYPSIVLKDRYETELLYTDGRGVVIDSSGNNLCIPNYDPQTKSLIYIQLYHFLSSIRDLAQANYVNYDDIALIELWGYLKVGDVYYKYGTIRLINVYTDATRVNVDGNNVYVYVKLSYYDKYLGTSYPLSNARIVARAYDQQGIIAGIGVCTTNDYGECTASILGLEPGEYEIEVEVERLLDYLNINQVNQLHIAKFSLGKITIEQTQPQPTPQFPDIFTAFMFFLTLFILMALMSALF